jgi:hypothetical protein
MNYPMNFVQTRQERHNGHHHCSPHPSDEGTLGNIKECMFQKLPAPRVDEIYLMSSFVNDFVKGVQNVAQLKCDEIYGCMKKIPI